MKTATVNTARAMAASAVAVLLLAGCGSHKSALPPAPTMPAAPAAQTPDVPGWSADCQTMSGLLTGTSSALLKGSPQMLAAAAQAQKAATTMTDPKMKTAAGQLATYDQQEAAYRKNPASAPAPDSSLMNSATNAFGDCAKG